MRNLFIVLCLSLSSFVCADVILDCPDSAVPGEPLRVLIVSEDPVEELYVQLISEDSEQIVARAYGFPLVPAEGKHLVTALLGVPSTVEAGTYILDARYSIHGGIDYGKQQITIHKKDFRSEQISLNTAMSSLRQSDEPRKREETRELTELLYKFNIDAIYHDSEIVIPVEEVRITSFFGDRRIFLYADERTSLSIHHGIDFAGARGTEVHACGAGRVVMAKERILTGVTAVVEHLPGLYSLYFHMDTLSVKPGQMVAAGELLGTVGSTGLVTGPHLHWEVRISGIPVDPYVFVEESIIDKDHILSIITP